MSLPASFLVQAENHGCFSGCFGHEARFEICLDPNLPLDEMFAVYCKDCLNFRLGVLRSLLPPGTSATWLADTLTAHNRQRHGFAWALSGYHAVGPGFWLTAAYYAQCGLFLLSGARSRSVGNDLDLLMLSFQYGVASPSHPRMTDPHEFDTCDGYVDFSTPPGPLSTPQDFYASSQFSLHAKRGYQRVTVAEFRPIAVQAPAAPVTRARGAALRASASPKASTAVRQPRRIGEICSVCLAEVRERPLFTGSYIGCLCD